MSEIRQMNISSQIKKHRNAMQLSQDELAERIYVTRQTVSNWENGKTYPDIHSLLLLGNLFHVSLDELIKGDVFTMKQEINKTEVAKFNQLANIFASLFIASILLFVPLIMFFKIYGAACWAVLYAITMYFAIKVEKVKKNNDLHTYKEIVAFSEGMPLDEIQKQREIGKRPYQAVLKPLSGALAGICLITVLLWMLM